MSQAWLADDRLAGLRLDQALCRLAQDLGINAARRLVKTGQVCLNGVISRIPGKRIKSGDMLELRLALQSEGPRGRLIEIIGDLAFLYKPQGLHTAIIKGSDEDSLERQIPAILPDYPEARLLQRLDKPTSGIVCAALTPGAGEWFRTLESQGACEKRYLAVMDGELEKKIIVDDALDVRRTRKSRCLNHPADSPLRHTEFFPLASLPGEKGCTLAGCRIRRGARHQIRAHAASLGLPLLGDMRYGGRPGKFRLHHGAIFLPEMRCVIAPEWNIPEESREWLESGL